MKMDEIIFAGEPCLVIRSPLIPRTLLCNSLLHPLLSRLKRALLEFEFVGREEL